MLFENATIITMDAQRRILSDGAVAVRGDRIAAVGQRAALRQQFPQEERFDCRGGIVLPGLIDTHVHMAQALIRGCADDLALLDWLSQRVWVLQGQYTADDGRASAALCILEMLKSGTTAFVETMIAERYGFDGLAELVQASGIRAALSKIVMDIPTYATQTSSMCPGMCEEREASMRQALDMHAKWHGQADGRIQVWFGPRPIGSSTPDLLRQVAQIAQERDMRLDIHFCEVQEDVAYIQQNFGLRPTEFFQRLGLLGPRTLLVHAVWLDADDIATIAGTGTHISHNPASNAKLGSGIAPVPAMLQAGVNVSLGCDGGPSNNTYDLLRDLRLAAYVHKAQALDPTVVPAETVLEMATINGAKAMGLESEIGSLETGKKADLIVVDINKPHLTPSPNPVSTVVHCATGDDVDTVVIDGQIVVRDGRCLTLDEEAVLREARQRAADVYRRAGIEIKPRWPVL